MFLNRYKKMFIGLSLATLILNGCGDLNESVSTTLPSTDIDAYPMVIEHAFGQTTIVEKPERIAAISWGNQDVPLALGVAPVGTSMANYGVTDDSGLLPWTREAYAHLGVDSPVIFDDAAGLDYEAISLSEPDVILAAYSGITKEEYDLLSSIAPVVAYPEMPWQTYWRDQIRLDAKGMGMTKEGNDLVKSLESLIAEKVSAYPELSGKRAAFFWFTPSDLGKFYVYLPADPRAAYLIDLGMIFPPSVLELSEDETSFALELSAENADILSDVDIIVTYGSDELLLEMQNDALLGLIPAIKNGAVLIIPAGTPLAASGSPSPLSIPYTIDSYLELLSNAAIKAGNL